MLVCLMFIVIANIHLVMNSFGTLSMTRFFSPDISLTCFKFPDISRFSRQVVNLTVPVTAAEKT